MTDILSKLPKIQYGGYTISNLTVSAKVTDRIFEIARVFYPYTIKEGERPDTIAYDYYGSSDYTWLVLISAKYKNIYTEWPLQQEDFRKYLVKKYGDIESILSTIDHYRYVGINSDTSEDIARRSWTLSPRSFMLLDDIEKTGWDAVTIYEREVSDNDAKRQIQLISNEYLSQIEKELSSIFNGS